MSRASSSPSSPPPPPRLRSALPAALLALLAGPALAQAGPWSEDLIYPAANGVFAVFAADVDGDGDVDAISGSGIDNRIVWYENALGDGSSWIVRNVSFTTLGAHLVQAADVDGDGDLDVLSASFNDDTVSWHENLVGDGTAWFEHLITDTALQAKGVFPADVDRDGDVDVFTASGGDDTIAWYENTAGTGTAWTQHVISTTADAAIAVFGADVDEDGDLDVFAASQDDDKVAWHENTAGDGSAWTEHVITTGADAPNFVFPVDVDGDGDLDVFAASANDDKVAWHENTAGDGSAWTEHVITTGADVAVTVVAADLDGDGDVDALSASQDDDEVTWYENAAGDGSSWVTEIISTSGDGAFSVATGDVDGDGDLDVFAASRLDDSVRWYENLAEATPGRACGDTSIWAASDGPSSVFAIDVDGDGDVDALSASQNDDTVAWYENTSGVGYAWTQHVISVLADRATAVFAADVDGDGDVDALSASRDDDTVAWYANTAGDGTAWTEGVISATADGARSVHAGDVDGDGDLDVLSASAEDDTLAWYVNAAGDGSTWAARAVSTSAVGATSIWAVDVDRDGDLDVAGSSAGDDTVAWYENANGVGTSWTKRTVTTTADGATAVRAADVDRDGDPDLVSASTNDATIAWHENVTGDGLTWSSVAIATTATSAASVHVVDLDRDGDLDVLAASAGANPVAWYENLAGDGSSWAAEAVSVGGSGATAVFAADVDRDGDPDVLSARALDDAVTWHENVPAGSLVGCPSRISLSAGGVQLEHLDAGAGNALGLYFLLTTTTGTSPGQPLSPPSFVLPLNFSNLFLTTALKPNLLIPSSLAFLDAQGRRSTALALPAGLDPGLAGTTLHHAYFLMGLPSLDATFVSNAVPLLLVP